MHEKSRFLLLAACCLFFCLFSGVCVQECRAKAPAALQEGLLLAAFGTSIPEARTSFAGVEKAFRKVFPEISPLWTFTSQKIRTKLRSQGENIPGIAESLDTLARKGVEVVRVQPLHVLAGWEYNELERAVVLYCKDHAKTFKAVYFGRPLLESREDARIVAKALLAHVAPKREAGRALVLMSHGNEKGRAGLVLEGVREVFSEIDPLTFIASVEGERRIEELTTELAERKITKVLLCPLMLVAGDHARNDLSGDESDSWKSILAAKGLDVTVSLVGLGEIPEVAALYARHAVESTDDLTKEPIKK